MKTMRRVLPIMGCCALIMLSAGWVSATNGAAKDKEPRQLGVAVVDGNWAYQLENRTDPFRSFIKKEPELPVPGPEEEVPVKPKVLTGMQRFEPGQLTLVAIMFVGDRKVAMVEDDTGRGYPIYEGTLIGSRDGYVDKILPNEVLIVEPRKMRSGQEKREIYVMRLKTEGE